MKYDRLGRSSLSRLYISKCLILGVAVSVLAVFAPVAFGQTSGNVGHIFDGDKMPIRLDPELMRRQKGYSLLVKEASNFQKVGKLDEAQRKFAAIPENFAEASTAYVAAREGLAGIYTQRGLWGKAIQEYEKRFDPEFVGRFSGSNDVEMRCRFALVLCRAERFDEAIANYTSAREILSGFDIVRTGLPLPPSAVTFKSRHDLVSVKTHLLLAVDYLIETNYKQVESEAALGSELGDDNRLAHLYTGLALSYLGKRTAEAKRELEMASSVTDDPRIKKAAEARIAELK